MRRSTQAITSGQLPETYAGLVGLLVPRPIHDKVSYENTVAMIDALAGAKLSKDQDDYLDILSQQVEAYEAAQMKPYSRMSGIALVKFLLSENSMNGDDLAELLEVDRSAAYKILKGARGLTAEHIRRICERFAISADAFLGA